MKTTLPSLPVIAGIDITKLAATVADLQDAGAPESEFKPLAKMLYPAVRLICAKFQPWRHEDDPGRWDTLCGSGSKGRLFKGDACLNCPVFAYEFHPRARANSVPKEEGLARVRAWEQKQQLIQISKEMAA